MTARKTRTDLLEPTCAQLGSNPPRGAVARRAESSRAEDDFTVGCALVSVIGPTHLALAQRECSRDRYSTPRRSQHPAPPLPVRCTGSG
jgi:hypothetical protein